MNGRGEKDQIGFFFGHGFASSFLWAMLKNFFRLINLSPSSRNFGGETYKEALDAFGQSTGFICFIKIHVTSMTGNSEKKMKEIHPKNDDFVH